MGIAAVMLEMADRAIEDEQPHPEIYGLLVEALALVRRGVSELAGVWFAARLLRMSGHRPAADRCVVCGNRLRGDAVWSASLGGCLDQACRARDPRAAPISRGAVALLRFLLDAPDAAVRRMAPGPPQRAELAEHLRRFAETRWEVRLRAADVVGRMMGRIAGRMGDAEAGARAGRPACRQGPSNMV
jgi:DNA repair protein RecO (recombination protein O)